VKLADFGLSKRLTDTTAFHTRSGTPSYLAPEILNYLNISANYTNAVDIWAVGCILYRLVAGVVPFPPGPSLLKYCEDKSQFPYDPLFDCSIKSAGVRFLRQLLHCHPSDRPSAFAALRNDWILSGKCYLISDTNLLI
jgi:serine/threonine protein kinase